MDTTATGDGEAALTGEQPTHFKRGDARWAQPRTAQLGAASPRPRELTTHSLRVLDEVAAAGALRDALGVDAAFAGQLGPPHHLGELGVLGEVVAFPLCRRRRRRLSLGRRSRLGLGLRRRRRAPRPALQQRLPLAVATTGRRRR